MPGNMHSFSLEVSELQAVVIMGLMSLIIFLLGLNIGLRIRRKD